MALTAEPVELTVESLGGLGDGIATYKGQPVFIAKSCAGDRLRVQLTHYNQNGYQANILDVISNGPDRQPAPCPYYDRCGGCALQHVTPAAYQTFKTRIVQNALTQAGYDYSAKVEFLPPASRRRVEFKIGNGKLAYHEPRSHTPVAIERCLILKSELEALIAPLNNALAGLPFITHLFAVSLTAADSGIDLIFTVKNLNPATIGKLDALAETLGVARISVREPEGKPILKASRAPVEMQLGKQRVPLPPGAFLQASSEAQSLLISLVLQHTLGAKSVIDLFCGIGTYSFPLAENATVHAVEGDREMVQAISSVKLSALTAQVRDLFKNPLNANELSRFDAAVINPPRLGAKAQTQAIAESQINKLVMVSCNPATFARDAKTLRGAGYRLVHAVGVDQFVWSQHLEIVAVFER